MAGDRASEENQATFYTGNFYCHHIIAVDEDGNALLPLITRSQGSDGSFRYSAKCVTLADEDIRGAKVNPAALAEAAASGDVSGPAPFNARMADALTGRRALYGYLEAMFEEIEKQHPREIVIYAHGGLNAVDGAIAKSALLADTLEAENSGKYFIGICWNSDLMPTYDQHLFSIREGLHQRTKAVLTSPAMLLSDIGGAAVRMPLNIIDFLFQDIYTVRPETYKRTRLANVRYNQINEAPFDMQLGRLTASDARDQTTRTGRQLNFGSWLLTSPIKLPSTFFLDWLGSQPWKNMLRRTRTMFERESEFLPELSYRDVRNLAAYQSNATHKPVSAVKLLDELNSTGRTGAVWQFCDFAQQRLSTGERPVITLVGHSMGAIVGCELVARFHEMPLDNLVFEAAACSIRDFKTEVVPYLEEQNLRDKLWGDFKSQYKIADSAAEPSRKTRFFNLCLHDNAENGEKNPGTLDLSERGSLLTWIDTLYQSPESENDRTLGRWINAILSTDDLPKDILNRITIKEFGRNRRTADLALPPLYGYEKKNGETVLEPMKHGEFTRFGFGEKAEATNLEFWSDRYREPEPVERTAAAAARPAETTRAAPKRSNVKAVAPAPVSPEHKTIGGD